MSCRTLAIAGVSFLAGAIASEYIGLAVGGFNTWATREFGRAAQLKIDFQSSHGCPSGNLVDIRRQFSDDLLWLERGADSLIICADQVVSTNVDDAPQALAREFPGCLQLSFRSLKMLRASDAVCALPNNKGYVCDAATGVRGLGPEALGMQTSVVTPCTLDTLEKFGFYR